MKKVIFLFFVSLFFPGTSFCLSTDSEAYLQALKTNETNERTQFFSEYGQFLHKEVVVPKGFNYNQFKFFCLHNCNIISHFKAIELAIHFLNSMNFQNICIKKIQWCVAPFGAYVIMGTGNFTVDQKAFSSFKLVVPDGSECPREEIKDKIELQAKGFDEKGNSYLYPFPDIGFNYSDLMWYDIEKK